VAVIVRIAAIVAVVVTVGASASPTTQRANGRIAFEYLNELVLINPDGSGAWPAHEGQLPIWRADSWSPDGTRLLVDEGGDIYAVDPDGGHETQLTFDRSYDSDAAYSPDGTKIAFESDRDGSQRIWVMNADGSGAHAITNSFTAADMPTWSPDGSELAFAAGGAIWLTSADGVGARRLVDGPNAADPAWSPDGATILFDMNPDLGGYDVYSARVSDGALTRLTTHPASDTNPVWSPDGTRIAFTSTRTGSSELFTMAPDGSDQTQLTNSGAVTIRAAWQPLDAAPEGCTIWGTPGNDLLVGSPGHDVICGLDGNDHIVGGEGDDVLFGGPGNDTIVGGPGQDLIVAGQGDDIVDARDGYHDTINAGAGTDSALIDRGVDYFWNVERAKDPDPTNLARGRPVTTSWTLPDRPAARIDDGRNNFIWGSYYAPQWVEIDLGSPQTVARIALVAAQTPNGSTDHVILGRAYMFDRWRGLGELRGDTRDGQLLQVVPTRPWRNIRYVRVETKSSPSWVAWREIAVFRAG
jgi:WD40-like Beta Propeller Repeat/RTX calcium-binding nonapeptide repeat (4 copies)/F5/8 type C domain